MDIKRDREEEGGAFVDQGKYGGSRGIAKRRREKTPGWMLVQRGKKT